MALNHLVFKRLAKLGRLAFVLIFLYGLFLAWQRLAALDTPLADVALTGAGVAAGVIALFIILPLVGRFLGRFVSDDEDS